MRFVWLLTATLQVCAQPVVSRVEVLTTHGTARIVFETSDLGSPTNAWLEYGVALPLNAATAQVRTVTAATSPVRSIIESGLAPSTRYFFKVFAKGPSGTSDWRCTEGGIGWMCDTESGLGVFVTADLPQEHPAPPASIAPVDTRMPAITGQTFEVSVNGDNRCANFQQQLRACALADASLNHQIVIPAGASCVGTFQLPSKTGSGTCVVRTSTPDRQLPPEGVRIDPSYEKRLATIATPASAMGQISDRGAINAPRCNTPPCTQGWRFVGIQFTVEDLRKVQAPSIDIGNVREDGVITTMQPHGLSTYEQIYVAEVEGFDRRGPNGVFRAIVLSPTMLKLQQAYFPPTFSCSSPPCHKPGTGRVTRSFITPVREVTNTTPVIVKTTAPHGLSNHAKTPVLLANAGALTVDAGHGIPAGPTTIKVEGSSVPEWNGYWATNGSTATTITVVNAPRVTCSADCGSVVLKETLQVAEVEGNTAANGGHSFTVLSPTEIQLDDVEGNGDYTSGGFIAFDPDFTLTLISLPATSDRIVIDRCYVNGRGFPNRILYAVVLHSTNSGIVDSYVDNINGWRSFHPKTRVAEHAFAGPFLATSVAVEISNGVSKKIHNNFLSAVGITIFAQEGAGPLSENVQITRNRLFSSPIHMAGSPVSDGRYYPKRHHLEFKRSRRVLIDGNIVDGNWSDFTPCGPALALSIRGTLVRDNITSDFTITNNIFRNTSSAIQIIGADSNAERITLPTARVRVHNNLFYEIDNRAWISKPGSTGGGVCGYAIQTLWGVEDVTITNNTAAEIRGSQPQFFTYSYGRSEGVVVRNNVFTHNQDNGAGAIQRANSLNLPGMHPPISGTPAQGWEQYFRHGSDFSGNVVVPGVRNTTSLLNLDMASANISVTKRDCETYYAGFRDIVCAGTGSSSETASERLESIFMNPRNKDFHLREFPGKGADIEAIAKAIGANRDAIADVLGPADALIRFFAASEDACSVDYTTDPEGDCERVYGEGGSIGPRTVALSNLRPATDYFFRIQCPSEQLIGHFQTLP